MNFRFHSPKRKYGFTVIELLAVAAILAILAAILAPSINKIRSSANTVRCASNLRQIGAAVQVYCLENDGVFPYSYSPQGILWPKSLSVGLSTEYEFGDWFTEGKGQSVFSCPEAVKGWYAYRKAHPGTFISQSTYMCNGYLMQTTYTSDRTKLSKVKSPTRTPLLADARIPGNPAESYESVFVYAWSLDPNPATNYGFCSMGLYHGGGGNVLCVDGHVERVTKATPPNRFIVDPATDL